MTEFGSEWPLWELKVEPKDLTDQIHAPLGGLALVEVDVDPRVLLEILESRVHEAIDDSRNQNNWYWYYETDDDHNYRQKEHQDALAVFPDLESHFAELTEAARVLHDPIMQRFGQEPSGQLLGIFADKRRRLSTNHHDKEYATSWLGATQPGLKVLHAGQWINVDGLPRGHMLVWRGQEDPERDVLPATKHQARFTRVKRRIALLSWQ